MVPSQPFEPNKSDQPVEPDRNANTSDDADHTAGRAKSVGDYTTIAPDPNAAKPGPIEGTSEFSRVPNVFGRYRLLRTLGHGGMGTVYLAHDTQLDRPVALKMPGSSADESAVRKFLREARAAATLHHPNLCPVYDAGEFDGLHFLTMAYIEGRPLSSFIRRDRQLPAHKVAAVVRKLAKAIHVAHEHGVVHRDLKPTNVIIDKEYEPVVVDFGLAFRDHPDEQRSQIGSISGTPAYMAPEQVRGQTDRIGPATDVYALGVILYEMLVGRVPFGGSLAQMFDKITRSPPPRPTEIRRELPAGLEAICLKALAKEPADRFASAKDFASALKEFLKVKAADGSTVRTLASDTTRNQTGDLAQQLFIELADEPPCALADEHGGDFVVAKFRVPRSWVTAAGAVGLLAVLAGVAAFFSDGSSPAANPSNAGKPRLAAVPPPIQRDQMANAAREAVLSEKQETQAGTSEPDGNFPSTKQRPNLSEVGAESAPNEITRGEKMPPVNQPGDSVESSPPPKLVKPSTKPRSASESNEGTKPESAPAASALVRSLLLPPHAGNPRNVDGDFLQLRDGRLLFAYVHSTNNSGPGRVPGPPGRSPAGQPTPKATGKQPPPPRGQPGPPDPNQPGHVPPADVPWAGYIGARFSSDGGLAWTEQDQVLVPDEADKVIRAVSLVRLSNDDIAIFYLKELADDDCRPYCRTSSDEGATWTNPVALSRSRAFYRMHSSRAVRLSSGRLILPVTRQANLKDEAARGSVICLISDDGAKTWRASRVYASGPGGNLDASDPGVVELTDDALLAWFRTTEGVQYASRSNDGGQTWSQAEPSPIISPNFPATIRRVPGSENLLIVWNSHTDAAAARRGSATPLSAALSRDAGRTWSTPVAIEDSLYGSFSHPAIAFVADRVCVAYRSSNKQTPPGTCTQITSFPLEWLLPKTRRTAED